jgi:hypothetical protein
MGPLVKFTKGKSKMERKVKLKRKMFFVDERKLRKAKKILSLNSEAEVVRVALDRILEMEEFWRFMEETRFTTLTETSSSS